MCTCTQRLNPPGLAALTLTLLATLLLVTPAVADESQDCATCHENISQSFAATEHGRLASFETLSGRTGCSTCHGDGAAHMDSGGDPEQIDRLGAETAADASEVCATCHRSEGLHDWEGSTHALSGIECVDCHDVHSVMDRETMTDSCYGCHQDVQAQFQYPSHHPVREGNMGCESCHDPHGSSIGLLKSDERPEELCMSCHSHLQGPFIFEHEPVSEGCDSCHSPHGAVANNLLVQNEPFLCLQCHETHFHAGLEAEQEDEVYIPRYDPTNPLGVATDIDDHQYPAGMVPNPFGSTGYKRAYTTKCTQCHTHVHGTDLPSQTVPSQGRGLMR